MKESLTLITEYGNEDISKLKIYFDSETNQYRNKPICPECKQKLDCYCYNTIEDAIEGSEAEFYCWQDWIKLNLKDDIDENKEMIDNLVKTNVCELYDIIQLIECGTLFENESDEFVNKIINYCNDEIDKIINNLPDEILREFDFDFDCDLVGEYCNV
jgi:hypothetical protein